MINIMIVDDDAINRTAVATMIDWKVLGCQVVFEAAEGASALEYISNNVVDMVITDMKMPIMDGLELIQEIRNRGIECDIAVISSYNEFNMVREAFKLGIDDYCMKAELRDEYFYGLVEKVKTRLGQQEDYQEIKSTNTVEILEHDVMSFYQQDEVEFESYYILAIQLEDLHQLSKRFGNIRQELVYPMCEVLKQIPKLDKYCKMASYSETKLLLYYKTADSDELVQGLCKRMIILVQNFLNVEITIGISMLGSGKKELMQCIEQAVNHVALRYIYGEDTIFTFHMGEAFDIVSLLEQSQEFDEICEALKQRDAERLVKAQTELFYGKYFTDLKLMRKKVLQMILLESLMLEDNGDNIWNAFMKRTNYCKKVERLLTCNDVVMWSTNYNAWVLEYLKSRYTEQVSSGSMEMVKAYIQEHFSDAKLTLGEVAEIVGLNEQYFCSKFKKAFGSSYVEYLTNIRIEKAKQLIANTTMKMYEVSEAVGFSNTEHFNRVFRKYTGQSPKAYRQK